MQRWISKWEKKEKKDKNNLWGCNTFSDIGQTFFLAARSCLQQKGFERAALLGFAFHCSFVLSHSPCLSPLPSLDPHSLFSAAPETAIDLSEALEVGHRELRRWRRRKVKPDRKMGLNWRHAYFSGWPWEQQFYKSQKDGAKDGAGGVFCYSWCKGLAGYYLEFFI